MATFTITTTQNVDELTSKAGGDTYNVNGGALTIDQNSRVGLNQTTSASLGPVAISATLGGTVNVDGRYVRIIPYDTGTGNVPAWNTVISRGSASGKLIGVYSALTAASTATGAAMPASGYIKIKQWNGVAFSIGALTGIGANATATDRVGWLEIVGDEAATLTAVRLGQVNILGEWFEVGTTDGNSNQTMQIPNEGLLRYIAGVFIEQNAGMGDYEFWPNAGTTTTTGTESWRGKCVWINNAGLVRIGNSGAATNGYTPVAGLKVVVGNIFFENCTTAARTANVIPNATIATRYDFTTTGGGVIVADKCNFAWYPSFAQAYSVALTNLGAVDSILLQECASPIAWSKVGVGNKPTTALSAFALTLLLCFAGGTLTDCIWQRVTHASSGHYTNSYTDIAGFTFVNNTMRCGTIRGNATTGSLICTRAVSCTWTSPKIIQGKMYFVTCNGVTVTSTSYVDCISSTTVITYASYVWYTDTNTINALFSGLSLPGTTTQPYTALLGMGVGSNNVKFRNVASRASPLDLLGGGNATGLVYVLVAGAGASDVKVQRVYCSNTRTGVMTGDNSSTRVTEENVYGDYADAADVAAVLNYQSKGRGTSHALTAQVAVYGTHWRDCFTSAVAGRITLLMNEATTLTASLVALTGGAAFTSAGGLYMPTNGQTATFTTPEWIVGHTSFQNAAPTMAGGTASNYTLEYQIDKNDGGGYGAWTVMSAANLSGETGIDASLGFKMQWRITTTTPNATAITSLYILTNSTGAAQDNQYPLDPVPVAVTVKDINTDAVIEGVQVLVKADAGGALPFEVTVTITRVDTTATVAHTAHGLVTNDKVVIKGADQDSYNGLRTITYIDADSYSYTVSGAPATPATGTIKATAVVVSGLTNASGVASATRSFGTAQPIGGRVRKSTGELPYKTAPVTGTVSASTGLALTVLMIPDV